MPGGRWLRGSWKPLIERLFGYGGLQPSDLFVLPLDWNWPDSQRNRARIRESGQDLGQKRSVPLDPAGGPIMKRLTLLV
jgi:hypothetical protein